MQAVAFEHVEVATTAPPRVENEGPASSTTAASVQAAAARLPGRSDRMAVGFEKLTNGRSAEVERKRSEGM